MYAINQWPVGENLQLGPIPGVLSNPESSPLSITPPEDSESGVAPGGILAGPNAVHIGLSGENAEGLQCSTAPRWTPIGLGN